MEKSEALPGPITLVKEAWTHFRRLFWYFFGLYILYFLAVVGAILLITLLGGVVYLLLGFEVSMPFFVTALVLLFSFIIFAMYAAIHFQVVQTLLVQTKGKDVGYKKLARKAVPYIRPIITTSILSAIIIFGGYLLFIIPGMLFSVWFSFIVFIIVTENKSGWDALYRSREYIRGRFWQIIWRMIAVHVPLTVLSMLTFSVQNQENGAILSGVIDLASFVLGPFFFIYSYTLYTHVRDSAQVVPETPTSFKRTYILLAAAGFIVVLAGVLFLINVVSSLPERTPDGATFTFLTSSRFVF